MAASKTLASGLHRNSALSKIATSAIDQGSGGTRQQYIAFARCTRKKRLLMTEQAKQNPVYGRKLRLAIFGGRGIPSTYSGTETFFIELAPRLAESGHDVIVYCRKALFKERPPVYKGVRLIYTSSI